METSEGNSYDDKDYRKNSGGESYKEGYFTRMVGALHISIIFALICELGSACTDLVTFYPEVDQKHYPENDIHEWDDCKKKPPKEFIPLYCDKEIRIQRKSTP